eukprot:evm.model.scf_5.16 EVM.evm.TU.scf_5.16   scf_5:223997-227138(-)
MLGALKRLSWELHELDLGHEVERIQGPPTPANFLREYVSANKPCIFTGCVESWHATNKWSRDYLLDKCGDTAVTIDVTPNGRGDAVTIAEMEDGNTLECFAQPWQEKMHFGEFVSYLESSRESTPPIVPYLQKQNNNLLEEFPQLRGDIEDAGLHWAMEAFGAPPDAVNLWVGDERSVTSFHKDHYENIYVVIAGTKTFTLLPPSSVYRLHLGTYPAASYTRVPKGDLVVQLEEPPRTVVWSPVELPSSEPGSPLAATAANRWPLFFAEDLPGPMRCEVRAGEVLYLPSLWHHHVTQTANDEGWVVAVNFWYDMKFDAKYAYFKLVEDLAAQAGLGP